MTGFYICRAIQLSLLFSIPLAYAADGGSFLSDTLLRTGQVQDVLDYTPAKYPACESPPTGPIEMTHCDYESIESVNEDLYHNLHQLVNMPFFKYFQVDLYRECPFWDVPGSCKDINCAITTVDESDVPERWRAAALSKLEPSSLDASHKLPGCYYRDSDFCFLDDNTEGDYFDLSVVPERFTGYSGPAAHSVWKAIYEENCFGVSELQLMSAKSPQVVELPDSMSEVFREDGAKPQSEQCLEKRVYYKIVSGLHASISTHICLETLNQTTGEWGPSLECFVTRVASHPERLQYIYFDTVLLLRAVARLGPYLSAYDYCSTGTHEDDAETKAILQKVVDMAQNVGRFDETVLFRGEDANILKEEFKTHFRNVTRIMDCVGCDKCRLWGKVQTTGVATALKILFELDEKALDPQSNSNLLQRAEIVALINTLHRLSESLAAVEQFRKMWKEAGAAESEHLIREAERAAKPRPSSPVGSQDRPVHPLNILVQKCQQSATLCFAYLLKLWERITSVLHVSGKEHGPLFGEL